MPPRKELIETRDKIIQLLYQAKMIGYSGVTCDEFNAIRSLIAYLELKQEVEKNALNKKDAAEDPEEDLDRPSYRRRKRT